MNQGFLSCRGLVKRFGSVVAVNGVDLNLERGRTYAILGPSGCGKTTLLRLIAGFDTPDEGCIEMGEQVLVGPSSWVPAKSRRVGLVFQDYALFPHLNVESNVGFGLPAERSRKRRVAELLSTVGLEGLGSRMPHELSGGQQQRVALARSLAPEPELILLDEPFSNLDLAMRAKIRSEVKGIIEPLGITAIFVTHDQEEALSMAEEVAVMVEGRVLQTGRPADMYCRPANRQVAHFLGDANFLLGEAADGHVKCELGNLPVAPGPQGVVEVMVRPENLAISEDGGKLVDVVSVEYYGHDQMVTVRLPSGRPVIVRMLAGERIEPGQRLGLQVRGDAVVFAREG